MEFEWDEVKAAQNERKHGVAFSTAVLAFYDSFYIDWQDTEGPHSEPRWVAVGLVEGVELFVVFTVRKQTIRLISARKATKHEHEEYWNR